MSETNKKITSCGDVIELLCYKGESGERSFSLIKTNILEDINSERSDKWNYMLIVDGDYYPISITEECAKTILKNPKQGERLVYNRWMNRYR